MQVTKIQIFDSVYPFNPIGTLDLDENSIAPLNFSISDIRDISKRNGVWSKTFKLKGNKNNNNLLNNYFDVNVVAGTFDVNKKTRCAILQNGTVILDNCYLILMRVNKLLNRGEAQDDLVSFDVQITNTYSDFFTTIATKELKELDFAEFNHIYTAANVAASFNNDWDDGYKYVLPWINDNKYYLHEVLPGIYAKQYFDKIHAEAGFSYTWAEQFDSNYQFDKLIIPYSGDKKKLTEEYINDVEVIANNNTVQNNTSNFSVGVTFLDLPEQTVIVNNELKDNNNLYNPATSVYDVPAIFFPPNSLQYEIEIDWDFQFINNATSTARTSGLGSAASRQLRYQPQLRTRNQFNTEKGTAPLTFTSINQFNSGTSLVNWLYQDGFLVLPGNGNIALDIPASTTYTAGSGVHKVTLSSTFLLDTYLLELKSRVEVEANNWEWRRLDTGALTAVNLRLRINSIKVRIVPASDCTLLPGMDVNMKMFIPPKVKQTDFLKSIYQKYNLYATVDPDNPTHIIYKTRDLFYDSGELKDWTFKLDKSKDSSIEFIPEITGKRMILSYKDDDQDYILSEYRRETGETYAQVEVIFDNENVIGIDRKEEIFSPTINLNTSFNANLPVLNADFKYNLRILLDNGQKICPNYSIEEYQGSELFIPFYPHLSMLNEVENATFDIGYAQPVYYAYNVGIPTFNNIYELFWRRTLAQINAGKMYTAYFNLNEIDIANLKLNDKIKVGNALWYINRVIDYDANKKGLTKVELLSVEDDLKLPRMGRTVNFDIVPLPSPGPVVPGGPVKPVMEAIQNVVSIRNNEGSLILTEQPFINMGNGNVIQSGARGIAVGDDITVRSSVPAIGVGNNIDFNSNLPAFYVGNTVILNEESLFYNGIDVLAKYISVTRATLLDLITNNELEINQTYFITDRNIWVVANSENTVFNIGRRQQRIIKNTFYTPQTIPGIFDQIFLGIYGQTINAGSVPVSNNVIGGFAYYAIWGGRMWIRNNSGADVPGSSQGQIQGGWIAISTDDNEFYETKIFEVGYDVITDTLHYQKDDRVNIVSNRTIGGFETVNLTDWGNLSIRNNQSFGIYNNFRGALPAFIFDNNVDELIIRNRNIGVIERNRCRNIINNSNTSNIDYNIVGLDIINNTNLGPISANRVTVNIELNSNTDNISQNTTNLIFNNANIGRITSNITLGNIQSNINNGIIENNLLYLGGITSNGSNVSNIIGNNNAGRIHSNGVGGGVNIAIRDNANKGDIEFNTCLSILSNRNLGNINSNVGGIQITNNTNSGSISSNNANPGATVVINLNRNNGPILSCTFTTTLNVQVNTNNGSISGTFNANVQDPIVNKP